MNAPLPFRSAALLALLWLVGCRSLESPLTPPTATSTHSPQKQLQKFDPFPDTRIGPRVAGLRPPGFRKPVSEPTRWQRQGSKPADSTNGEDPTAPVTPPAR